MATSTQPQFEINGVIDTSKTVLQNLEVLCSASGCWLSYDIAQAKWAVVINRAGSSVASFDDTNIVGSISIASTGITELYNSVEIEFPHKDIKDRIDYVTLKIPDADRFPNELDNVLKIQFDCINDPLHAEILASRELKQSRVDKVINFRTDYSYLGLKAGDLIDVTSSVYSYYNKVFRIVKITEDDGDDGTLSLSINALEYNADVYDTTGLIRTERFIDNGIIPEETNTAIDTSKDQSTGTQLLRLLGSTALTGLINSVFTKNPLTGKITQLLSPKDATVEENLIAMGTGDRGALLKSIRKPDVEIVGVSDICEGSTLTLTLSFCSDCLFDPVSYNYSISGIQSSDINFPLTGTVNVPGTMTIPILEEGGSDSATMVVNVGGVSKSIVLRERLSYTYTTTASSYSILEGASTTVTLVTTNVANGQNIAYVISGDTSQISTALTGNVTISSNSAALTVNTTGGPAIGGQTFTVTFTSHTGATDYCNQLDNAVTIAVTADADTCQGKITVPVVWCPFYGPRYVGGVLKKVLVSLKPVKYGTFDQAKFDINVYPTETLLSYYSIPKTVSVNYSGSSEAVITVTSVEAIDAEVNAKAGIDFNVLTSFNSIPHFNVSSGPSLHYLYYSLSGTVVKIRGY